VSEALTPWLTPALLAVLAAAAGLVVFTDWRISFVALAVQYAGASLFLTQLAVPEVALVKLISGILVVGILSLTGWQAHFGRAAGGSAAEAARPGGAVPTSVAFRVMATLIAGVAALYVASQPAFILPGLDGAPVLNMASYALMGLGLLNLGLTEEPLKAGMGLLTVLLGFEVFYAAVEPALAIVALLAAVEFAIALAVSYLALVQRGGEPAEAG